MYLPYLTTWFSFWLSSSYARYAPEWTFKSEATISVFSTWEYEMHTQHKLIWSHTQVMIIYQQFHSKQNHLYIYTHTHTHIYIYTHIHTYIHTRWFKYDRDKLWLVYTQIVPVIFEPPCVCVCVYWVLTKNGAVSKVNKKFIAHLTQAQCAPSTQ
jgi:hypothetical protein